MEHCHAHVYGQPASHEDGRHGADIGHRQPKGAGTAIQYGSGHECLDEQ